MKLNRLFYLLAIMLCFSYATSCSEDNDDNLPVQQAFLNESNYSYEGDMQRQYLNVQIADVQIEIDSLQAIIDNGQGSAETEADLEEALLTKSLLTDQLERIRPRPIGGVPLPPPPPPCPTTGTCMPINLDYIVCDIDVATLNVYIYNNQEILVGSTENSELQPVPGFEAETQFQNIDLNPDYTGDVFIVVNKTDTEGIETSYQINGYIRP